MSKRNRRPTHRRGWMAATAALVIAASLALVWLTRGNGAASATAKRGPTNLERAAMERFANSRPRIRLPSGREIHPPTEEQERAMKVRLFKSSLVRELERSDPSFRGRAEEAVADGHPREVTLQWEDVTGNQELSTVVTDTRDCGVDFDVAPEIKLLPDELGRLPCIDLHDGVPPWEPAIGDVTIIARPVEPGTRRWQGLVHEQMKQMAVARFEAHASDE